MKLPFFLTNKTQKTNNYLALFLKEEEGIAMVLNQDSGRMEIKEKEHFNYSNGWEHIAEDIDDVLFRFEQRLNISLDQAIFFVYSHFVDEKTHEIKKPYLQKIKEIVKNLELHALGYIECSEAVLRFLEEKEEIPLTAILVELDKINVSVFVYKGGRVAHSKVLSRTDNLIDDLLSGFEDLKGKFLLPARIILYNSKDLDDESSKILTYRWSEDYFIQLPRVEIIKEDDIIDGLVRVFHEQIQTEKQKAIESVPEKKETFGFVIGKDVPEETKPLHNLQLPQLNALRRSGIFFGIICIVLGLLLYEVFFHKATVTVFVPTAQITKKVNISNLQVMVSTSSAVFTDSKQATGKRDTGDRAKGAVTVHNFDDREKLFTKGTVLETGGLTFTLDDEVKVASSSLASDGSAKLPGKKNAAVTASAIGPESNLEKGKRFKIDDLSTSVYFAINDAAFTGGTRKQIQTVSKKDAEDLEANLINKAKNQQPTKDGKVSQMIKQDEEIIPQLSNIELRDLNFSKEVGEEASEVSLRATADTVYFFYKKDALLTALMKELQPFVKEGYLLEKDKIHYTIDSVEKKGNNVVLRLSTNGKTMKRVATNEIAGALLGKNRNSVESILKKQYKVQGFELTIKGSVPILNTVLPFIKKNIHIVISSL